MVSFVNSVSRGEADAASKKGREARGLWLTVGGTRKLEWEERGEKGRMERGREGGREWGGRVRGGGDGGW